MKALALFAALMCSACGTCEQQVQTARVSTEAALSALAPVAPRVIGEDRAADWLAATAALLEASANEALRACQKNASEGADQVEGDESRANRAPGEIRCTKTHGAIYNQPMSTGIDLERYHEDVARIFYAYFSERVRSAGFDASDVLQEVYAGILARNAGRNPWHQYAGGRSASSYIYMVTECVVMNHYRKHSRWNRAHQIGVYSYLPDDSHGLTDAGSVDWPDPGAATDARALAHSTVIERLAAV